MRTGGGRAMMTVALALAASVAAAAEMPCWGLVKAQDVYVRSGPDKAFRDMGTLERDSFVRILDVSANNAWFRVIPPDTCEVWIAAKYVDVEGERGALNADRVWVRVRPDTKGEAVNQVSKGAAVTVKGCEGDWLKILPPPNTEAWVSADLVVQMTDAEVAAHRAKRATEKADEERRLVEEAQRRLEQELVARADSLLAAEQKKGTAAARSYGAALRAYQDALRSVKDANAIGRVQTRIALIQGFQAVQAALRAKTAPSLTLVPDPAKLKGDAEAAVMAEELALLCAQAAKVATDAAARPKAAESAFEGWVSWAGPAQEKAGATHQLTSGGQVVALIRSEQVELDAFVGLRVRVTGEKPQGVVAVDKVEAAW